MSFQRLTLSSSIVSLLACCALPAEAAAVPSSCREGFKLTKQADFEHANPLLESCITALDAADETNLVWAHFLAAVTSYQVSAIDKAYQHASAVSRLTHPPAKNPLSEDQVEFIKHLLNDATPHFRTSLKYTGSFNFGLSASDGECGRPSKDLGTTEAGIDEANQLARCRNGQQVSVEDFDLRDPSARESSFEKKCAKLLEKFETCKILYCARGVFHLTEVQGTTPIRITCDWEEIAFLGASAQEQMAAIRDALEGPHSYSMEPGKRRSPPETTADPFSARQPD